MLLTTEFYCGGREEDIVMVNKHTIEQRLNEVGYHRTTKSTRHLSYLLRQRQCIVDSLCESRSDILLYHLLMFITVRTCGTQQYCSKEDYCQSYPQHSCSTTFSLLLWFLRCWFWCRLIFWLYICRLWSWICRRWRRSLLSIKIVFEFFHLPCRSPVCHSLSPYQGIRVKTSFHKLVDSVWSCLLSVVYDKIVHFSIYIIMWAQKYKKYIYLPISA